MVGVRVNAAEIAALALGAAGALGVVIFLILLFMGAESADKRLAPTPTFDEEETP
jgi:hypothetical protein